MIPHPKSFTRIGLWVPDLDAAVQFYSEVLGFFTIMGPTLIEEDGSEMGRMCTDVFGPGWRSLSIAHMPTADRVGVELFEFDGNYPKSAGFDFRRHGCFISACRTREWRGWWKRSLQRAAGSGCRCGRIFPGEKPCRMVYAEDPFSNVFEVYSHGHELTYSGGACV
jgi:catechol 2,3-dioxygenase-like lactoylglutathione lyase family enzyme